MMDRIRTLLRLTGVEILKFRLKPVTWVTWIVLFLFPALIEVFLAVRVSREQAVFPQVIRLLYAGEVLLVVAVTTVVVSVMALGNDYELGIVRTILIGGIERHQFVVSKVLATVVAALANGCAYMVGTLLATTVTHLTLSDVPLREAAGMSLVWRALESVGVVGLVGFCFAGVVVLALVLGRSAWVGMLAGLGAFLADLAVGGLNVLPSNLYRYTVSYHTLSLLARHVASGTGLEESLGGYELSTPGRALVVLLIYGCALTLGAVLVFRRQDLMLKV
jgi:ABC-type transport system involved in multi-copper enzyme maturation permease subunit